MKKVKKQKKLPKITVGPFKKVTYYQADIEGPDCWLEEIANVGRRVITDKEYLNIGFNHIVTNMIDYKYDLSSLDKPSVGTVVAEKNRQQLQKIVKKKVIPKPNNLEVRGKFYVDPPSGWQYGFPTPYDQSKDGTIEEFLIAKGYPKKDVKWASENCRMWSSEDK
jgi:hypothetical protein